MRFLLLLAATLLEDDPTFNAGTGATLTASGDVELDASLMYGPTMRDSVSVSPPGTYGTTRRMGRVMGVFCVCACAREQTKNTAATNGKIDLVAGFIGWPV